MYPDGMPICVMHYLKSQFFKCPCTLCVYIIHVCECVCARMCACKCVYMYTCSYVHMYVHVCGMHTLYICLYIVVYDIVYKLHLNHLLDFHSMIASSQIGIFMSSMKLVTPVSPDNSNCE